MNMKPRLIDSHCHLNYKDYEEDLDEVMETARRIGVERCITINTQLSQVPELYQIVDRYVDVFCTVGNHPNESYKDENLLEEIIKKCAHEKVVGIGETGLDYFYETVNKDIQRESFDIHIEAANQLKLPLIIHTRDAEEDTLASLKKCTHDKPGVLHCFTSSYDMAKKALDAGFYISFSGILTFKSATDLQETARKVPLDRILVETDAPYLTPTPKKKDTRRNEPAFVYYTAKFLAELKGLSLEEVGEVTTKNCFELFSKLK